jgi:pimeloyl-ACP methyl ester carboxylesterase
VLVHGTGGDSQSNWGHLVERFAASWTVVRPDYAGSGATLDAQEPLSVATLAAQVVAAAKAAGAVPFDLVGFSLGASIAAYIAAEYPDLVRSIVLLAGFASGEDSRLKLQFELWRDLIRSDRRSQARQVELDLILDVSGQVKRIAKPTLVIGCTHDHIVRPAHARAMAAMIPGARYAELDSGHLAPLECPDEFVRLVTDFLRAGAR